MRTFERTHGWIGFQIDLSRAPADLWLQLGEAASKCEHLARIPLRPATARALHQLYLAKGAAATTAIEGNTLSEAEVLEAVEGKLEVPLSKEYLKQEVENIITACNRVGEQVSQNALPAVTPETISEYNRLVRQGLPKKPDVAPPGEVRQHDVVVGNAYRGAPHEDCIYLLGRLCDWLSGPAFQATTGHEAVYAIIRAIIAHLYLAWIHPFGDGNGRTARLVEFHVLLATGVPSPAAHLLSNHYNQTRDEYYRELRRASESGGDVLPFLRYAVRGFVAGLRDQLEFVWAQQADVTWRNYVHETFQSRTSTSEVRQRHLALDLGEEGEWVAVSEIATLSPRLAVAYAGKTAKMIQRDLGALEDLGLIVREPRRVRAKREIIQSFLPLRVPSEGPQA
jgi:Fic family protein